METRLVCFGLFAKRPRWAPTWRGWCAFLFVSACLVVVLVLGIHRFLAVNCPVPGGILVMEGWLNDDAMADSVKEFRTHAYDRVVVTGGPIERGSFLSAYGTYAQLGAATLLKLGIETNKLETVPAKAVKKDRTYASALALSAWMKNQSPPIRKVNLLTQGAHARRSWLLFKKAIRKDAEVGVIAIEDRDYEPGRWYRSSMGVRFVLSELIAYAYVKFFFFADE